MSNLRLLDPTFGDNFETALRRFFSPTLLESEVPHVAEGIRLTSQQTVTVSGGGLRQVGA